MGMKAIQIYVSDTVATVTYAPVITTGCVGLPVEVTFNAAWDGLTKTVVFYAGDVVKDRPAIMDSTTVPAEVLQTPGHMLKIGIYGVDADGKTVITSVPADVDHILAGADPSGDEGVEPGLPIWQQMLVRMEQTEASLQESVNNANTAATTATTTAALADQAAEKAGDAGRDAAQAAEDAKNATAAAEAAAEDAKNATAAAEAAAEDAKNAIDGYEGRIKELEDAQESTDNELTRHEERLMSIETEYVRTVNGRYPFEGNVVIGDDSAIGNDFWSSKNIIDRMCPALRESGSVVTCVPVEGYPLEVVSTLPESEEGISAVTLWRGGANLFPPIDDLDGLAVNGITFRVEGGKIILNGTATAAVNTGVKTKVWLPAGTYTVSGNPYPGSDVRLWLRIYGTTTQKSSYNGKSATVTLEEAAYVYLYITINSDAAVVLDDLVISTMVNAGDIALPWEAYRGESFAADFGITVHGGSYDWTSGVLTDENGNVTQLEGRKITALSGTNTLYSDTGDTQVTGRKDPIPVIENQNERIAALEASVTALLGG